MLTDTQSFLNLIRAQQGDFFAAEPPISVARAPGRLDVMGGIADYSGSLVLELPLALATLAAVQPDSEPALHIRSLGAAANDRDLNATIPLELLFPGGLPLEYGQARSLFAQSRQRWAAYVAGCWLVLAREELVPINQGARVLVRSEVPRGAGVSSSAALEVAVMRALCDALGVQLAGRELAIHCQTVENLVVGAPCGVMDQVTAALGDEDQLLALRCQPCDVLGGVNIPAGLAFWGIDSGLRHAVSGSDYTAVRVGAFMGYRIIAQHAGLTSNATSEPGKIHISDTRWRGYLANIAPSEFEQHYHALLPEQIGGAEFLAQYGGITDLVTQVDPARSYAVRAPTAHPIHEHFRVRTFATLLRQHEGDEGALLGELMYQSHASYSACGLGSVGTDLLVQLVREAGHEAGLLGAKITGGGSGGTVAVLGRATAGEAVQRIAEQYAAASGHAAVVFSGSSPGAAAHGVVRVGASS